jgi:hypothetical protein
VIGNCFLGMREMGTDRLLELSIWGAIKDEASIEGWFDMFDSGSQVRKCLT